MAGQPTRVRAPPQDHPEKIVLRPLRCPQKLYQFGRSCFSRLIRQLDKIHPEICTGRSQSVWRPIPGLPALESLANRGHTKCRLSCASTGAGKPHCRRARPHVLSALPVVELSAISGSASLQRNAVTSGSRRSIRVMIWLIEIGEQAAIAAGDTGVLPFLDAPSRRWEIIVHQIERLARDLRHTVCIGD